MTNCKHEVRRPADYNDGTIHGWNGGDCPVHPETVVEYWMRTSTGVRRREAGGLLWDHSKSYDDIIAFRVVKEYVEPKVIWVNEEADGIHVAYGSEEKARILSVLDMQPTVSPKQLAAQPDDVAALVEIGNEMAKSIRGNYYLPGIAGKWEAALARVKGVM